MEYHDAIAINTRSLIMSMAGEYTQLASKFGFDCKSCHVGGYSRDNSLAEVSAVMRCADTFARVLYAQSTYVGAPVRSVGY